MLVKERGVDPDGVSTNSDYYNICDVNDQVIINELSEFLHKYVKLVRATKFCQVFARYSKCTKIPKKLDLS